MQGANSNSDAECNEWQIIYQGLIQFTLIPYDIRQLRRCVPVQDCINITRLELNNDKTLKDRTKWKPSQIVNLLNICIEETHFYDYRGNIWTQTDGLAIGKSKENVICSSSLKTAFGSITSISLIIGFVN